MPSEFYSQCFSKLGELVSKGPRFLGAIFFSVITFAFAAFVLEGLYQDRWNIGLIYYLSDIHSFFSSEAGKPIIAPILVVLGGAVGWSTTRDVRQDWAFWVSFAFYILSIFVLLWALILVSPPVRDSMSATLEAYEIDSDNNPLHILLSAAVATLSGWLANRITKRSSKNNSGPS